MTREIFFLLFNFIDFLTECWWDAGPAINIKIDAETIVMYYPLAIIFLLVTKMLTLYAGYHL